MRKPGKAQAKLEAITSPDRVLSRRFARSIASMQKLPGYTVNSHGSHLRKTFTVPRGVHIVFVVPPGGTGYVSYTPIILQDPGVARQIYAGATELSYHGNPLYAVHYVAGDVLHEFEVNFRDSGQGIYQFPMPQIVAHAHSNNKDANTVRLSEAAYSVRFVPEEITLSKLIRDVGKGVYVLTGCRQGYDKKMGNKNKNVNNSVLTDNAYVHRRQKSSPTNSIHATAHALAANKKALSSAIFVTTSMSKTIGRMIKETQNAVRAQLTDHNPYILVRSWLNIAARSFYKPFNEKLLSTFFHNYSRFGMTRTTPTAPGVINYTVHFLRPVYFSLNLNTPGYVIVTIPRYASGKSEVLRLYVRNEKELDAATHLLISRLVL